VLFWLSEDELAETGETFPGLNLGWDVPKPIFIRGGKGCYIISVKMWKRSAQNHLLTAVTKVAA